MGISTAVYTTLSRSLNRGGGLNRGRYNSTDRDSTKTKLYRY